MSSKCNHDSGYRYVLITPARNEAATLANTIEAVVNQSVLPQAWVIVSDNSSDQTDDIVRRYQAVYPFIYLLRREDDGRRDFGSKVRAIDAGYKQLAGIPHDFIGNLDADITFAPHYFHTLLERFQTEPQLGIAGGVTFDYYDDAPHERYASLDSVGGAVQLFRRECYEQVGGYRPLPYGSEDALALHMARWKGWHTQAFPDLPVMHHRKTGTAAHSIWRARFHQGVAQHALGWSPVFVAMRTVYRTIEKPILLGSLVRAAGFLWAAATHQPRQGCRELLAFIRQEQHNKLRAAIQNGWRPWRSRCMP